MTDEPCSTPGRALTQGSRFGWIAVPSLVLMSTLNSQWSAVDRLHLPWYLVVFAALLIAETVVPWVRGRRFPTEDAAALRLAHIALGAFLLLVAYAFVTTLVTHPWVVGPGTAGGTRVDVPHSIVWVPLLQAAITPVMAYLFVRWTPPERRAGLLWWFAAVLAAGVVLGWIISMLWEGSVGRLHGPLGGAAVIEVATLLGMAVMLAAIMDGRRVLASWLIAAVFAVATVATGARASLVMGAVWAALVLPRLVRRGRATHHLGRTLLLWASGIGAIVAVLVSPLGRRLNAGSEGRVETWTMGWRAVTATPWHVLLGLGSGVVWPWYLWEAGLLPTPYRSRIRNHFGFGLYHAHSLYVTVFVEMGLVGLILLGVCFGTLVVRRWQHPPLPDLIIVSALLATLVGFALDSYLLKNFPIAFVWWLVLFAALLGQGRSPRGVGVSPVGWRPGEGVAAHGDVCC